MEDYSIEEIHNINNKVVMLVEDDEHLIDTLSPFCEIMPLRFSYNLDNFTASYIEKTKTLFSYYYNITNTYNNELLRLKKHFKHFLRKPFILYVNKKNSNYKLIANICNDLKIECISNRRLFISKIKNDKKIFFIDSDGTLRYDNGKISAKNKEAINKITINGDYAIICTARPRYHTLELMKETKSSNYIISSNGAEIYDVNKNVVVKSYYVDKRIVYQLIDECYKHDLRLVLSTDNDVDYITKEIRNNSQVLLSNKSYKNQLLNVKIKTCMVIDSKINDVFQLKEKILNMNNVCIINEKSKDDPYHEEWFCVGNKNATKGNALVLISNYLKVPLKNTISIGNDNNDISMFENSNISFAVSNSSDNIKKRVDYIVSSNNNDGVAEAVNLLYNITQ